MNGWVDEEAVERLDMLHEGILGSMAVMTIPINTGEDFIPYYVQQIAKVLIAQLEDVGTENWCNLSQIACELFIRIFKDSIKSKWFFRHLWQVHCRDARKRNAHLHLPPIFSCRPPVFSLNMMAFCHASTRQYCPVATKYSATSSTAASFSDCTNFLQVIRTIWRDDRYPESKLNHEETKLHSGQIFRGQILSAVDRMRCVEMIHGDNSGDSSSFAANLSPWCTGGGES